MTDTPTTVAIRRTNAEGKGAFPRIPDADLELAQKYAQTATMLLRDVYRLLSPHYTLSVQAETAGKGCRNLALAIETRRREYAK